MEESTLYLSADKLHVLDADGKVVYDAQEKEGKMFYVEPSAAGLMAEGKVCVEFKSKRVCVEWDNKKYCIGWGDIEVCVKWEYK